MYNQLGNYSNHYSRKEKVKNHWAGDCQRPNTPNRRSTSIIYLFNLFSCEKTALLCSPFLGSLCHLGIKYNYNKLTDQSFSPHLEYSNGKSRSANFSTASFPDIFIIFLENFRKRWCVLADCLLEQLDVTQIFPTESFFISR